MKEKIKQQMDDNGDVSQDTKDAVYRFDRQEKSLTGRTPERIAEETGIDQEEIFPSEARILYIGDPWQRMGREINSENLTIIDYEFGDSASFITDDESFRARVAFDSGNLLCRFKEMITAFSEDDGESRWLKGFIQLLEVASQASSKAGSKEDDFSGYAEAVEAWIRAKEYIEAIYQKEIETAEDEEAEPGDYQASGAAGEAGDPHDHNSELGHMRMEAWYQCVYAARGFRDVPDWNRIIWPKLVVEERRLESEGLSEYDRETKMYWATKREVDNIRLKKYTDKAAVVEAVFPELPFKDNSFDRFVASWSISAHVFSTFTEKQFYHSWQEIERVLKVGGEVYIFPLDYYYDDKTLLETSLETEAEAGRIDYKFYDSSGIETDNVNLAFTLWFKKLEPVREDWEDGERADFNNEVLHWERLLEKEPRSKKTKFKEQKSS